MDSEVLPRDAELAEVGSIGLVSLDPSSSYYQYGLHDSIISGSMRTLYLMSCTDISIVAIRQPTEISFVS